MLLAVTTKNFQKLGDAHFEFGPGLNLITGQNWAGKTTLLRAILFALGGARAVNVKSDHLVTKGYRELEVKLVLATAQGPIKITRGTKKAVVEDDAGSVLASGHTGVTALVEERLGLSIKEFLAFRVTAQGEPDALLREGSATLNAHLYKAAGVDLIDRAIAWLTKVQSEAKGYLLAGESVQREHDALITEIEHNRETKAELEVSRSWEIAASKLDQQQLVEWRAYLGELETYASRQQQEFNQVSSLVQQLSYLDDRLSALTAPTCPRPGPLSELKEEHHRLRVQVQEQSALYASQSATYRALESRTAETNLQLSRLREIQPPSRNLENLEAIAKQHSDRYSAVQERLRVAKETMQSAFCPTCLRPYEDQLDRDELTATIEALEKQLSKVSVESASAWDAFRAAKVEADRYQHALQGQAELEEWLIQNPLDSGPIEALKKEVEALTERWTGLGETLGRLSDDERQWGQYLATHQQLSTERDAVREKLGDRVPSPPSQETLEGLSAARERVSALQAQIAAYSASIGQLDKRIEGISSSLAWSEKQLELKKAQLSEIVRFTEREESADRLLKLLKKNRTAFLQDIWDRLLSLTNSFLVAASKGSMTALVRTQEDRFEYVEGGESFPIEVASGMQLAILGVALKLALGMALAGEAEMLLLDEITAAGCEENSATLVDLLRKQSKQTLLVSHRQGDSALADKVILM